MLKKLISTALVSVVSLSLLLTGCGSSASTASKDTAKTADKANSEFVVGFIYVGPVGDGGYTYAHDQGRKQLEDELKAQGVKTIFKESVPESPEVEKVMKDMIDQKAKVIFATSFGYMDYVDKVAKEYPDVKFLHCSGYKSGTNFSNYFGRIEEPRYLSGIVAGLKTKTNKIGYVGAYDIPEVVRGINAFTLGVQSVNKDAKVYVNWTNTWYDPAKEKDAAKALLSQGADVIAQHQDTTGPQIAAEEAKAFAIGYNTDSKSAAPKAYMTAPIWNWGPYYVAQVKAAMNGTWKSESYWEGMKSGIVKLAPLTENAPAEAKAKVEDVQKKMLDGSFQVFTGPIKDQTGKVRIEAGKTMSDKEQLSLDWFVQGVEGSIAKK
ncbi:MAG: med [Clostridiales bacterium]|jgi:basic membrane protein A|nr:med [Clostridiales bacterium]